MNHPVLLPKRKEFGFLKAPQSKFPFKSSFLRSSIRKQEYITETTKPIGIAQNINALKLKYELKSSHLLDNKHLDSSFDNLKLNRTGSFNTSKMDLKQDHLDRQSYITNIGANIKNLKKKHQILNIYSVNAKKPKTAGSVIQKSYYNSKNDLKTLNQEDKNCLNENNYCSNDCISCKFRKHIRLDKDVTLRGVKKPINSTNEYERLNTTDSLRSIDFELKTPNNRRSQDFYDYRRSRSTKSGTFDSSYNRKNNENLNIDQKYYEDDEDDDIIPKLTLWLV